MHDYTKPHYATSALITIDTQCDTLDGQSLEIPGTSQALPNIQKLLRAYRQRHLPIVHIIRIYKKDGSNVDLCRKAMVEQGATILLEGSPGCGLATELLPDKVCELNCNMLLTGKAQDVGPNEVVIYKPRWGAFYNTRLDAHLKEKGIDTLVFTGCNYPNCPRASIYEASERDYRIVLADDAISGLYPKAIEEMGNIGVLVAHSKTILSMLISESETR